MKIRQALRKKLRDQWFAPYGVRALKTRRFWWDFMRAWKRSGWYVLFWFMWLGGAVYNVENSGFLHVTFGNYEYFIYLGLGPFFWGLTFAIVNVALFLKFRRVSRDFSNDAIRARLSQLDNVACWVDCCRDPNCKCGDCLICGKVLPDTEQADRAYVEKVEGILEGILA